MTCGVYTFKTMEEMVRIKHTTISSTLLIITGLKSIVVNWSSPFQMKGHLPESVQKGLKLFRIFALFSITSLVVRDFFPTQGCVDLG